LRRATVSLRELPVDALMEPLSRAMPGARCHSAHYGVERNFCRIKQRCIYIFLRF
jgi:hypothetical protein